MSKIEKKSEKKNEIEYKKSKKDQNYNLTPKKIMACTYYNEILIYITKSLCELILITCVKEFCPQHHKSTSLFA